VHAFYNFWVGGGGQELYMHMYTDVVCVCLISKPIGTFGSNNVYIFSTVILFACRNSMNEF